jgi:DNA adenine methylase
MRYSSPLRYPGGKQKLTPFVSEIINENNLWGCDYVEPYAGGAGVAIDLLFSGAARRIHLNDACPAIHAFWSCVLDDAELLCRRISRAWLDVREWRSQKEILSRAAEFSVADVGFATFYLNRVNRSGILSGGVIGGIEQRGKWQIDARFPKDELIRRIELIQARRADITLHGLDAEEYFRSHIPKLPRKSLIYCDPPYFRKAERLYLNHYRPADHERIARIIQKTRRKWLVSYDSAPEILALYDERRHFVYDLQYNAGKAYKGKEVFVFADGLSIPNSSSVPSVNIALQKL